MVKLIKGILFILLSTIIVSCDFKFNTSIKKSNHKIDDFPTKELATIAAFCRKNAGLRVYEQIKTDRLLFVNKSSCDTECMRFLNKPQISFIEIEVVPNKFMIEKNAIYQTLAPTEGKYRFSFENNGHSNCKSFERVRAENNNPKARRILPVPLEKCVAAEKIDKFEAIYSYETGEDEPQGREDGEKIAFKRSVQKIENVVTEKLVSEGIVYDIYLGTHYLSYGFGISDGVGGIKCQGNASVYGQLDEVILKSN